MLEEGEAGTIYSHERHQVNTLLKKKEYSTWITWFPRKNILPPAQLLPWPPAHWWSTAKHRSNKPVLPGLVHPRTPLPGCRLLSFSQSSALERTTTALGHAKCRGWWLHARFLLDLPSFRSGALFKEKCKGALLVEGKCRAERQTATHSSVTGPLSHLPTLLWLPQPCCSQPGRGLGTLRAFGGSVKKWQQKPTHNIFIIFPILAHRPQQKCLCCLTLIQGHWTYFYSLSIWHGNTLCL